MWVHPSLPCDLFVPTVFKVLFVVGVTHIFLGLCFLNVCNWNLQYFGNHRVPTTTASFLLPGLINIQISLCADESCLLVDLDGAFLGKLHVKLSKISEID